MKMVKQVPRPVKSNKITTPVLDYLDAAQEAVDNDNDVFLEQWCEIWTGKSKQTAQRYMQLIPEIVAGHGWDADIELTNIAGGNHAIYIRALGNDVKPATNPDDGDHDDKSEPEPPKSKPAKPGKTKPKKKKKKKNKTKAQEASDLLAAPFKDETLPLEDEAKAAAADETGDPEDPIDEISLDDFDPLGLDDEDDE